MSGFSLTHSQREAIETRGEAVLVSAGAGSGKTRVLVERLMAYITDEKDPKDVDSFLIITFTRAAAAELRDRIARRLSELCAENPTDRRLRRQAALCARAQIGTIHSFCTNILREHAHLLGIAPDFRVAEEERCSAIKQTALERVLEKAYKNIENDAQFRLLADTVGAGRDDSRLESVVLELFGKMSSHTYPEKWADACAGELDMGEVSDAGETVWGHWLLNDAREIALAWKKRMEALLDDASYFEDLTRAYGESLEETARSLENFARAAERGWDEALACLPIAFPRFKPLKNPESPELAETVKAQRELCKAAGKNLLSRFTAQSKTVLEDLRAAAPAAKALLRLTVDFSRAYAAEKRRLSLLDFSDLEHQAVRLLLEEETGAPTAAAREISKRFTEIMVDEYQDVNAVQDAIFTAISKDSKNLFMVGDVKQSIYRFRLADPTIFLRRYEEFGRGEGGRRILLQENFRSRPEVLGAVNHVFSSIMSRTLGELDYDENARLVPGGEFPEAKGSCVTFSVVEPETDDEEAPSALEAEAAFVAQKIRALVDGGATVAVEDGERKMCWGDIAVLLRSPNSSGGAFRRALEALHIPVHAEQGSDFFSAPEAAVMLHLFAVTDNPRQDLPLISVLRSALFGFTADDLASVRTAAPDGSFFEALCIRAQTDEKSACFLETLAALRQDAADLPLSGFVWSTYARTGALALAGALPDGAARRENLLRLFSLAQRFEASGDGTLSGFVQHLVQLRERGTEPIAAAQSGNAVRLMSIHKSKGLEFPVVFLSCCAKKFNKQDSYADVTVHAGLGLGLKRVDTGRGVEYPTISNLAVSRKLLLEGLSEEMRVLYVAMTRAKERLYMTCAVRNAAQKLDKLHAECSEPLEPRVLETAQSVSDWLMLAFLTDGSPVSIDFAAQEETPTPAPTPSEDTAASAETFPDPAPMLDFRYPHAQAERIPVKLTATEMKSHARESVEDGEALALFPTQAPVFRMPSLGKKTALTGAEKGTATHMLLQHIRPDMGDTPEGVEAELARLCAEKRLRPEEADSVDRAAIVRFFRSETGALMKNAKTLLREQRFSVLVPAENYFPGGEGEEILLQGIVDCCIVEEDGITVLDFKTDRVEGEALQLRARGYAPQLRAYAGAMERLFGKPVRRCILAFLYAGEAVELCAADTKACS